MPTLAQTIDGLIASRNPDAGTRSRLAYWRDALGERELVEITIDDVDAALVALATRGRLRPSSKGTTPTGKPLKGSTINRYLAELSGVYVAARRLRLLPRNHQPPSRGLERHPEPPDANRYLTPEQVERLIAVCPLVDPHWGKLEALVRLLATTGLRIGNALALRWQDVDLERRTVTVARTKNGQPHTATLPQKTAEALARLPGGFPGALVFGGPEGRPYSPRRLWRRAAETAGLPRATPHWLRHSFGYRLAQAGASQTLIMHSLGHRSLSAAARYTHASVEDRRLLVDRVFG